MSKWYGNLSNRIEEGKNYTGREIRVGDDITMYLWSDRHCYYVTEVIDQKHIKVKPYFVCADKTKPGGMGHQDWVFFKTLKERDEYLGRVEDDSFYENNDREETWTFRYGKWMEERRYTEMHNPDAYTKREQEHFKKNGWVSVYYNLLGKVSFGIRDYNYDWEF